MTEQIKSFSDLELPEKLLNALKRMKFETPTPIQTQAIPPALAGRDIIGSAQTGTGKTGAFGIPLIAKLFMTSRGTALVLTPTRELASQVMESLTQMLGRYPPVETALLIGGESMPNQVQALRSRPRLIVGTPGRVFDHLDRGTLMLHDTNFLVLDEMDRMLDMGFEIQLERICKYLTAQRQTLMFSATLPPNIVKLSAKYLHDPVRVSVGSTTTPITRIEQEIIHTTVRKKFTDLLDQLDKRDGSIVIFCKTKRGADALAEKLNRKKFSAKPIHGDLHQAVRDRVINAFRDREFRILVATDLAARGLDIPHIEHVINHDLPQAPEDYIHRIGRTARAGAEGAAVCLITPEDQEKWEAICKLMGREVCRPEEAPESEEKHKPNNRDTRGRRRSGQRQNKGQNKEQGQSKTSSSDSPPSRRRRNNRGGNAKRKPASTV